jgi:hypothetical protein
MGSMPQWFCSALACFALAGLELACKNQSRDAPEVVQIAPTADTALLLKINEARNMAISKDELRRGALALAVQRGALTAC